MTSVSQAYDYRKSLEIYAEPYQILVVSIFIHGYLKKAEERRKHTQNINKYISNKSFYVYSNV